MQVVVIGGGPAGMMSAIEASKLGNEVTLLEKMESLGKKLLITGKGRCNITSSLDMSEFIPNTPGNGMFLYSSFHQFTNQNIINLLKQEGLEVKEERGHRIFPITDRAKDVLAVFIKLLKKYKVNIQTNTKVETIEVIKEAEEIKSVEKRVEEIKVTEKIKELEDAKNIQTSKKFKIICISNGNKKEFLADKVILATGGKSYPATGSAGDGYEIAKKLGHTITQIKPSLVPLTASGKSLELCKQLQGLSLRNVAIQIIQKQNNKVIYNDFGEMLFTNWGVSGPIILSASAHLLRFPNVEKYLKEKEIILSIDLKPALTEEKLEERLLRDFSEEKNKEFKNSLNALLPKKIIEPVVELSKIPSKKQVNSITKEERHNLVHILKHLEIVLDGFRPIEEAIVTSGGISVKEINPKTMESKIIKGLYFAGEIIDVDAYTGGFNLQIAYSTGYVAGSSET